ARFVPLERLPLRSPPETLSAFGFTGAAIADDPDELAQKASRQAMSQANVTAGEIDALFHVSALAQGQIRASAEPRGNVLDAFCYRASWLQETLQLDRAAVIGIAQQGCAGMFSALRQARALLTADPAIRNVLCVGADWFGADALREILYNVVSDAGCAVIV